MPRSPATRLLISVVVSDVIFTPPFAYTYLVMLNIDEGPGARTAWTVIGLVWLLKFIGTLAITSAKLRPLAGWTPGERPPESDEELRRMAMHAYRVPVSIAMWWAALSSGLWLVTTLVLYFGFPDTVPLGPRSLEAMLLVLIAITAGAPQLSLPMVEKALAPMVESFSLAALDRKLEIPGRGVSFRTRLVVFSVTLALTPALFFAGVSYLSDARAGLRELVYKAEISLGEAMHGNQEGARSRGALVFTCDAACTTVDGKEAARALAERPALQRELERAAAAAAQGTASHPRDGAIAFRPQGDRRIGVIIAETAEVSSGTLLVILLFLFMAASWGPSSAVYIANTAATPVTKLAAALARVADGEVESAPRVPVYHQDEVGQLAKTYNIVLEQLREVTRRATEISKGALDVELGVRGELGDAFRGQLTSLRDIVSHIAVSAAQLAGAAGEMYAAAQEQEQAAQQQSAGIDEVSRTMESLLAAATHVTESTMGVLSKAERTRETTGRTAERIAELSAHAGRIGEILEVIREIADRSDLLALNASLEGTRAGEAGRGFALVAGEMRKLAERVTASVSDIKKLVSDVRASVSATVIATEESGKLAEGTTESARHINLVTQQQRSGTEQAGQSMRDVASMIAQSLAATQQLRTLAENLKAQADNLTGLVSKFRLPERRTKDAA